MLIALFLGAQAVPQSLLRAADDADGTYVQCLFATSRAANGAHLTLEQFEGKLASACRNEEDAAVRAATAVLERRGEPDAASRSRQEAQDARRSVVNTYRQILELNH